LAYFEAGNSSKRASGKCLFGKAGFEGCRAGAQAKCTRVTPGTIAVRVTESTESWLRGLR
jgi:hypothetical protein